MLEIADVTDLKCLFFKYAYLMYQADIYDTGCSQDVEKAMCTLEGYFDVYLATPTTQRLCECKFTNLVDTLEFPTPCATRDEYIILEA